MDTNASSLFFALSVQWNVHCARPIRPCRSDVWGAVWSRPCDGAKMATLSLKYGVDVKTLSGALGHYDAGFTLSTYTHATAEMKRDAADAIGNVISQAM